MVTKLFTKIPYVLSILYDLSFSARATGDLPLRFNTVQVSVGDFSKRDVS